MAPYISPKQSWLGLILSFGAAALTAFLLSLFLAGPRLGPWYDALLRLRPGPPVSREPLIIETPAGKPEDRFIEPATLAQVILTLMELDAAALVVEIPALSSGGGDGGGTELLPRFDEEFSLLGRNIRNLFEAIRVGSIPPAESARYVEDLVALGEGGKERLVAALLRQEGEDRVRLERAAAAFGRVWTPGDLLTFAEEGGGAGEVSHRRLFKKR